jgi:hypothetical protein
MEVRMVIPLIVSIRSRKSFLHSSSFALLFLFLGTNTSTAQISEYQECSGGLDLESFDENLTAQERIAVMDAKFDVEISDTERCDTSSAGGGGGGGGGGGAVGVGGVGGSAAALSQSAGSSQASPNLLESGGRSVAVSSDLTPDAIMEQARSAALGPGDPGSNGKSHESLASADNKTALAESILKKAEEEKDPIIKAALMKRYEELTQ